MCSADTRAAAVVWTSVIAGGAGASPPQPRCEAAAAGLNNPHGCCVWNGHVLVADAYNHRLRIVQDTVQQQQQQQQDALLAPNLSPRSTLKAKRAAIERAVAASRLQSQAAPGAHVVTCPGPAWKYPHDVAVAASGDVYVSDFDGNAVWKNVWEGVSQGRQWEKIDAGLQLNHPCGLSLDGGGGGGSPQHQRLAVADCYNNRVGVCAVPSTQHAAAAPTMTWSSCPLSHPTGVCWSRDSSSLAVADFDSGRLLWLRGDSLQLEGQFALAVQGGRSRAYDVECVGEGGGGGLYAVTDCVSSRVMLVHRDSRMEQGCAAAGCAAMMPSPPPR
jgi:hypothetical protein